MSSKRINIYIEKSIYSGNIDICEFTRSLKDPSYYEYICQKATRISAYSLDLKSIDDIFLRRRIIEFLVYSADSNNLSPNSFFIYRIRSLKRIMETHSLLFKNSYSEFLNNSLDAIESFYKKTLPVQAFIHTFRAYCYNQDNIGNIFEKDIWQISDYNISFERNASLRFKSLNFYGIQNETNKYYVKKYIEYLLVNTDNTINTILGRLSGLKYLFHDVNVSYENWTSDITESFISRLTSHYNNKRTIASRMITYFHFTEYLLIHDYILYNPLKKYHGLCAIGTFKHSSIAVDDSVVNQIFKILGEIEDTKIVLTFLLLYCVGMRVSEACSVKWDCLEKTHKGEFIKYYSLKMKKEVSNIIPPALYEMIAEYKYHHPKNDNDYLFEAPQKKNYPMLSSYFSKKFNYEMEKHNIKNPDGSAYHFRPHAYRHKMAVKMRKLDIPFPVIQEQLHHSSPEMTLAYIEYIDRDIIKKMDDFITNNGDQSIDPLEKIVSENKKYAEYMRKEINAQMLPNGICTRPVVLGNCIHNNSCLTCSEYRTSIAFLEVHKRHLRRVNEYIELSTMNGWLPQIESNKRIREILIKIIEKLESMGDESCNR